MRMIIGKDMGMISWRASDFVVVGLRRCENRGMAVCRNDPFLNIVNEVAGTLAANVSVLAVATNHFYYR
jgi:hypothetical protein